jgi:hypothetical protein
MSPQAISVQQRARAIRARTEDVRRRAQQAWHQAAHARQRASLVRQQARSIWLARAMPGANPLTRAITATILARHKLWERPPHRR